MASRSYVAGMLPNSPDNLRRWIMHPQEVKPKNAMPDVGVSEEEARHMTAYLYTLE
jgi:cytochrome c1